MIISLIPLSTFQRFSASVFFFFLIWMQIKKQPRRLPGCSEVISAWGRLHSLSWRLLEQQRLLDLFTLDSYSSAPPPSRPPAPQAKCYKHQCVPFSTLPTYFPAICHSSSSRPVITALLLTAAALLQRLPGFLGDLFLWPCVGCLFIILSLNNLRSLITKMRRPSHRQMGHFGLLWLQEELFKDLFLIWTFQLFIVASLTSIGSLAGKFQSWQLDQGGCRFLFICLLVVAPRTIELH